MNITELLKQALNQGASDIHLTVGAPPTVRVDGMLVHLAEGAIGMEYLQNLVEQVLDNEKLKQLKKVGEIDISYSLPGVGRFRISVFQQRGTMGMAIRVIKKEIPNISTLGVPNIVSKMTMRQKGLILVTGPVNSGKSTTLAAMLNLINEEKACHIITLEDPIKYLHGHKKSIINQREIGLDSESLPQALRAALRQDPDVILLGETSGPEIITMALTAAETGRLVLSALHTPDVAQTIKRLIDVFPTEQKEKVRVQLANVLVGIVSQRLLPLKDNQGKVLAVEFLAVSPEVRSLIRDGNVEQIHTMMQTGARIGMRSLDKHMQQLFEKGLIREEEALNNALDRPAMSRFLSHFFATRSRPEE